MFLCDEYPTYILYIRLDFHNSTQLLVITQHETKPRLSNILNRNELQQIGTDINDTLDNSDMDTAVIKTIAHTFLYVKQTLHSIFFSNEIQLFRYNILL